MDRIISRLIFNIISLTRITRCGGVYLFGRLFLLMLGENRVVFSSSVSFHISLKLSSTSFIPFNDFKFIEKNAKSDWTKLGKNIQMDHYKEIILLQKKRHIMMVKSKDFELIRYRDLILQTFSKA